jgi:hypothetical protein
VLLSRHGRQRQDRNGTQRKVGENAASCCAPQSPIRRRPLCEALIAPLAGPSPDHTMHPPSARRARRRIGELSLWTALYVALVTLPLFALMPQATGGGAGFWWDFGIALG